MRITFHGAARTVTGSKHLINTGHGKKLLLDCGLFQSMGSENETLNRHLGFEATEVDYLILSHAHTDHAGLIPLIVKQGYNGPIYATPATIDLCRIMLADSAHIQENDVVYLNKKRAKKHEAPLKPIYKVEDVQAAMKQFVPVKLDIWTDIDNEIRFKFTDSGHILGSAAVNLELDEPEGKVKLFFSGDVGRYTDLIIREPQPFPQADILICESTYGDRLHEPIVDAEAKLLAIIKETVVEKQGKLIIPAFSLGRTQELIYAMDRLHTAKLLPHIPIYVDSPLAINATAIMRKHTESFNPAIKEYMKIDANPFGFDDVHYIQEVEDSIALNDLPEPCIIISASGMMEAGRIKHHIKNNISNPNNTILVVGYVTPNSLGGKLIAGNTEVKIFGKPYQVRAKIAVLGAYSAHADYEELIRYLSCQDKSKIRDFFIVHGDPEAQDSFKIKLEKLGYRNIHIPSQGESFDV